jgi:hypothetical protein
MPKSACLREFNLKNKNQLSMMRACQALIMLFQKNLTAFFATLCSVTGFEGLVSKIILCKGVLNC